MLGDNTDELVDKLLARFKPGIVDATDGLSATAAEQIMTKLKDWLDGDDEEIGGGAAAAEAPAEEMEQLQVNDEVRLHVCAEGCAFNKPSRFSLEEWSCHCTTHMARVGPVLPA